MKPKVAQSEFNESLMPHNRREVFKDVMRQHLGKFLSFGLIILLCSLPLHFMAVYGDFYKATIYSSITPSTSAEEALNIVKAALNFDNIKYLIDIPLLVLLSAPLAGMARVVRQYGWEENVYFRHDFIKGIKQNGKQYALIAMLFGMIRFICRFIYNLALTQKGNVYEWLSIIPAILCFMFLAAPVAYALVSGSIYENNLLRNLRIGFRCYAAHPWKTLLAILCGLAIFLFQSEVWDMLPISATAVMVIHLVGRVISSVAVPFIMLGFWLFSYNVFDDIVNKTNHPDLIGKGTFPEEGVSTERANKKTKTVRRKNK